jgi:hypothetical protein
LRPVEVAEALRHGQFLLESHALSIREQLVEFAFIGPMRSFDLIVQLRLARPDLDVLHSQNSRVPVEQGLELIAPVGSDRADSIREFLDQVVDGIRLSVTPVDLERADSPRVVDRRLLIGPDGAPFFHFSVRNFPSTRTWWPGASFSYGRVYGTSSHTIRKPFEPMLLANAIDPGVGGLGGVAALEIPAEPDRSHLIRPSQVRDFIDHIVRRLV